MSVEASVWARRQNAGSPLNKLVLLLLADNAGADHVWIGSPSALAAAAEAGSDKDVLGALAYLVGRGLLRAQGADSWRLMLDD